MNTIVNWVIPGLLLLMMLGIVGYCQLAFKNRWKRLQACDLVCSSDTIKVSDVRRVVAIDLGYGQEIWLLTTFKMDVDPITRIIQEARVLARDTQLPPELENMQETLSIRF